MTRRILAIHYTPPGVVGGVESIIHQHSLLLADRGYHIELVAGRRRRTRFPLHVIPEIDAAQPAGVQMERELEAGTVSERFERMRDSLLRQLSPLVAAADVVIAHNAFSLHFSLPLTAALWEICASRAPDSVVAWCHDLAWTNPLYIPALHPGYPWDLLRMPAPNTHYVTVSQERKKELWLLWGGELAPTQVIPNGVFPQEVLRLSPRVMSLVDRFRLFDRDLVLFLPVRITRRKNIEAGIRVVRALKDRGLDVCYLITGPPGPHHPSRSSAYFEELNGLRCRLDLQEDVIFMVPDLGMSLTTRVLAELYTVADALLFPSAQEGFGIPVLEAGVAKLPVVLSDIPIFREVGGLESWRFDPGDLPDRIADVVLGAVAGSTSRLYRRVLREYRWDVIVDRKIVPLLQRGVAVGEMQ